MKTTTLLKIVVMLMFSFPIHHTKAGEESACFKTEDMGDCSRIVLSHVDFKSVVLQFVDPAESELGEGLARLFWREILTSISNVGGAGVILAYDRQGQITGSLGEQDPQYFLHNSYHRAALKIAQNQSAQMAVWGAVLNDGDGIYVQNYLTLHEPKETPWTTMAVSFSSEYGVSIPFMRKQFSLPAVTGTRAELFTQIFYTRCKLSAGCPRGIPLKSSPNDSSDIAYYARDGDPVSVVDMQHKWLQVQNANQEKAWINIYHLEMHPKQVRFDNVTNVNIRVEPNKEKLASVDLNGAFKVLDVNLSRNYPWYLIKTNNHTGWIRSDLASSRTYFFPAVHLIAGLYRYYAQDYAVAIAEFTEYLNMVPEQDNVTKASIYKLLAAAEMAGNTANTFYLMRANEYLEKAKSYTPYDASVHSQSALLNMARKPQFLSSITLLEEAYELNPHDPGLNILTEFLLELEKDGRLTIVANHSDLTEAKARLLALQQKLDLQ